MKKTIFFILGFFLSGMVPAAAHGTSDGGGNRLPYAAGDRFVVTAGYGEPPTHIRKDAYAIDLSKNGCDAYGAFVVAARGGSVWIAQNAGYNGGYGSQVLVRSADGVIARYAHLIAGSIPFGGGESVSQGTILGEIGNTGLVAGTSCGEHPGTHLHFALYAQNTEGTFLPENPEPISGYAGISSGNWYVSDNVVVPTNENLAAVESVFQDLLERIYRGSLSSTGAGVIPPGPGTSVAAPVVATSAPQGSPVGETPASSSVATSVPVSVIVPSFAPSSSGSLGDAVVTMSLPTLPATTSSFHGSVVASSTVSKFSSGGVSVVLPALRTQVPGGEGMSTSTVKDVSSTVSDIDDPTDDAVGACAEAP